MQIFRDQRRGNKIAQMAVTRLSGCVYGENPSSRQTAWFMRFAVNDRQEITEESSYERKRGGLRTVVHIAEFCGRIVSCGIYLVQACQLVRWSLFL